MKNLKQAIEAVPSDMREDVRHSLLVLADKLLAVEAKWGELGTESRVVWLVAQDGSYTTTSEGLRVLLVRISSITTWVENWSDCAKNSPNTEAEWDLINEARAAATTALATLHSLVDHVRADMNPVWKPVATSVSSPIVVGVDYAIGHSTGSTR